MHQHTYTAFSDLLRKVLKINCYYLMQDKDGPNNLPVIRVRLRAT